MPRSWRSRLTVRLHRLGDERGSALVLVVGSMLILAMLALTALTYAMSSQRFSRYDQDYTSAMAAAQSGVEDFISRVNRNDAYGIQPDCLNEAWRGPDTANGDYCGWNDATPVGWLPVDPSDTDPDAPHFHYSAVPQINSGSFDLTVTGRVNGVYRTVEATVGKGGSTDYVYYTDFESADPSNVQAYDPNGATKTACGKDGYSRALYWQGGRDRYDCVEITFIGGDVLDGQVFTNDTIYGSYKPGSTLKPRFLKQVFTAAPECAKAGTTNASWEDHCLRAGSVADFNGIKPQYAKPLYLQDTSASFATLPGCHYVGSTRVVFDADGTMTVWNKRSVNGGAAPVAIEPPGGVKPDCGTLEALDSDAGATVAVPTEMTVYVAKSQTANRQCYAGELGGPAGTTLPLGSPSLAAVPDRPTKSTDQYSYDVNMRESTKYCGEGNLYAEGVLKGRVTIAAAQSVVVTGDLVLAGGLSGEDMLGLVATNSVEIFHPRVVTVKAQSSGYGYRWGSPGAESEVSGWPTRYKDPTTNTVTPTKGVQIVGSIQTLQHSFLVQKYRVGPAQGTLLVNGSIAQRWRGIVGYGTAGYLKDYRYDNRLQLVTPPYFPKWANSKWALLVSGEVSTDPALKE